MTTRPPASDEATLATLGGIPDTSAGDSRADREKVLARGDVVGRYVVLERIGAGGMGVVYSAFDPELDRKIAIKVVLPSRSRPVEGAAKLQREAQAMAKLSHPNVVAVHDVGTIEDRLYIAMEFVVGQTLTAWLAEVSRTPEEIVGAFVQAGRGLAAAHAAGVVHRDFKPDNVMIDSEGRVRVLDFGLARSVEVASDGEAIPHSEVSTARGEIGRTTVGRLRGTPMFMAPEQIAGGVVDERSDQFSFCVVLWMSLAGEHPFEGDDRPTRFRAVLAAERRPLPSLRIGGRWRLAIERGLCVDASERWPSIQGLVDELARTRTQRRWAWVGGAGVLGCIAAAAAGGWLGRDAERCAGANEAIASVWNDARRASVGEALTRTHATYAAAAWARIAPQLDAWANAWASMHTEACEATQRRGEQSEAVMDLRMACLHRARVALDVAARVLSDASLSTMQNADAVVAGLPSIAMCGDIDALLSEVPPPSSEDADAVESIRQALAEGDARFSAGEFSRALDKTLLAETLAERTTYAEIEAEIQYKLGVTYEKLAQYDNAEKALRRAQESGARTQQWGTTSHATSALIHLLGLRLHRYDEAWALRELCLGLSSVSRLSEARAHKALGNLHSSKGQYAEAEAEYKTALRLLVVAEDSGETEVVETRANLALALRGQGRNEEAEAEFRSVLQAELRLLGPDHPSVARIHQDLAIALHAHDRNAEAQAEIERTLEIRIQALGLAHPDVAAARSVFANILASRGHGADAVAQLRLAIDSTARALGAEHRDVSSLRNNLGIALGGLGRYVEAEIEFRAATVAWSDPSSVDHPVAMTVRENLAHSLIALGRYDEAEAELRASIAKRFELHGSKDPGVAASRTYLGEVLLATGRAKQAEVELDIEPDVLRAGGFSEADVRQTRVLRAVALLELGRRDEALTMLTDAWRVLEAVGPERRADRAAGAFGLARALWEDPAQRSRARELAEIALTNYEEPVPLFPIPRAAVKQWLDAHPLE